MQRNRLVQWTTEVLETPLEYYEKIRKFGCTECNSAYAVIEKRVENKPYTECPKCKTDSLESEILGVGFTFCDPGVTTVGKLAEKNAAKLGRYGRDEKDREAKEANKNGRKAMGLPDRAKVEKVNKLNKMTPQQQQKYINTGEGL